MREPDFVIRPKSAPYLRRWWIIPRNRFFNIYLHQILADDDDRALHDHPWVNCSIVLKGFYWEYRQQGAPRIRTAGSITFRRATTAHRLELGYARKPCWSLFITGPSIREWGFHCPNGWKLWKDFVDARDSGLVGPGCGE